MVKLKLNFKSKYNKNVSIKDVKNNVLPLKYDNSDRYINYIKMKMANIIPSDDTNIGNKLKENIKAHSDIKGYIKKHNIPNRTGDFLNYPNGQRTVSQLPLKQVSPEFDAISFGSGIGFNNMRKAATYIANKATNPIRKTIGFVPMKNTFTRGIGQKLGVADLNRSGYVRGNPIGSAMSAHRFTKMYKFDRNGFRTVTDNTGRKGIAQRYYNYNLDEADFNALKAQEKLYNEQIHHIPDLTTRFSIRPDPRSHLLENFNNFSEYKAFVEKAMNQKFKKQPQAYFYDDGRNPLTEGHSYAGSKYGVRILHPEKYDMHIPKDHLHFANGKEIPFFNNSDVQFFRQTPFGTMRWPKAFVKRGWYKYGGII